MSMRKGETYTEWRARNPKAYAKRNASTLNWRKTAGARPLILAGIRRAAYKRRYGITVEDYDEMLRRQRNCCALCGTPDPGKKRFRVDHCRETGRIRGLLCGPCNSALGTLGDNVQGLARALAYVKGPDREHGEVARHTVTPDMFGEVA